MRLTILVPVFNEERTLDELLAKVEKIMQPDYELIIVNDASTDASPRIIEAFATKNKAKHIRVIAHPKNKGKGAGIQSALSLAQGRFFIIQDADLEYDPQDINPLLEFAESSNSQVVYGSRFKGAIHNMPKPNYYANKGYNFILRRLYPTSITDMHTCYKLVETSLLREIKIESNGFGYAPELVSKLLRRKKRIYELPVRFYGRTRQEGKKIGVADGVECIKSLLLYRFTDKAFK